MLGEYPIKFDEDDDTITNNVAYKGTRGLYDLTFMKRPNDYVYSEEDLDAYSRIISQTAAYLNLSTNRIKSSSSYKDKNTIKPIITKMTQSLASTSKTSRWRNETEGRGLLTFTNNTPKYVYCDNVNELCKRLPLLIASQNAGHSAHKNEILSIIEELHEAGIIKENGAMFEAIFTKGASIHSDIIAGSQ